MSLDGAVWFGYQCEFCRVWAWMEWCGLVISLDFFGEQGWKCFGGEGGAVEKLDIWRMQKIHLVKKLAFADCYLSIASSIGSCDN